MPEHGSKSEENCNLRAAKAGHSSNICLSSPNASVLHKLQTRLARGRLKWRHPWQPTRLIGWNNVWGEQCHLHSIVRCCFRIGDPSREAQPKNNHSSTGF